MQLLYISLFFVSIITSAQERIMEISSTSYTKMSLLIGTINSISPHLTEVLSNDLMFSGQFKVEVEKFKQIPTKKNIEILFKQGYPLVLFLSESSDRKSIEWRLYDTTTGHMVSGKQYTKKSSYPRAWAHEIADSIWPILTGQQGCFASKIAYCKKMSGHSSQSIIHIYMADFDGSNEQKIVALPTILMAPRWNNDSTNPVLFYSEHTPTNVRLMSIDMHKKMRIASNFPGVNMLPHFSSDGQSVVYCASKGNGNCQIYYYNQGNSKQVTRNKGNNFAPTFGEDTNTIYFCSDFQTGVPHIYSYDLRTDVITQLTKGAYCACPSYNPQKNQLLYTRMIEGAMQLCIYDISAGKHYQLTSDAGNKQECTWSPCGNYILFSVSDSGKGQLIILNVTTGERKNITSKSDICSYPTWSICYNQFPLLEE